MTADEKLDAILASVRSIEKRIATLTVKRAAARGVMPADDRDLDGQYGNPVVRKDPPKWAGDSFVGCSFSECSPEYLDEFASFKQWQAGKEDSKKTEESEKKAHFLRKDAARAAGWAARLRGGWTKPATYTPAFVDDDGAPPF